LATLFFSYAHADEAYRDRLEMSLAMLRREGLIDAWHDRRIVAGAHIDRVISEHLERSDIVLLLVSPDFLASEYCYDVEMTRALERQRAGDCIVIPVIVRPCDWHGAPFGRLNALPTDGKPITKWSDLDEAFLDVTKGIRRALGSGRPEAPKPPSPTAQASRTTDVRSANLRVRRVFTQQDREDFLRGTFEYIERYFENSLAELERRHPDIQGRFRVIDANRFTSVAYRAGRPLSRCTVWFGGPSGLGRTIGYVANDSGDTNSFNEALSANVDEQSLFLEPMGMSSIVGGSRRGSKLTMEGGAELLWSLFMEPLQRP
jgi:hypothetical protein